jgi:hypothetical protein
MSRRVFLILLAIFVLLVAVTVFQEVQIGQQVANLSAELPLYRVYPGLAVLDIQAIRLSFPGLEKSFILSRDANGEWAAPDSTGTLDADAATNIARSVVLLTYQRTIPLGESPDLSEYGFGDYAVFAVEVLMTTGEGHALAVGGVNATRSAYYALVDDYDDIYLVDRGALDFLITQLRTPPLT